MDEYEKVSEMLEAYMRLLQASLDYLAEEFDILPEQIHEAEIMISPGVSYLGSVLFPQFQVETFLMRDERAAPSVYWMNDYKDEGPLQESEEG